MATTATERAWDEQLGGTILETLWTDEHTKSSYTPCKGCLRSSCAYVVKISQGGREVKTSRLVHMLQRFCCILMKGTIWCCFIPIFSTHSTKKKANSRGPERRDHCPIPNFIVIRKQEPKSCGRADLIFSFSHIPMT